MTSTLNSSHNLSLSLYSSLFIPPVYNAPDFGDTGATGFEMDTAAGGVWAVMTAFLLKRLVPGRTADGFRRLKSATVIWLIVYPPR